MRTALTIAVPISLVATIAAMPASALVLTPNTGWVEDTVLFPSGPSAGSPYTFTVTGPTSLKVTDCCVVGDILRLFNAGTLLATSTFYAGAPLPQYGGNTFYEPFWESAAYSKIDYLLGAGSYSLIVTGSGTGGVPERLGIRLDTAAVPEPAAWAMMIGGVGFAGGMLRRRRTVPRIAVRFA